MKPSLALAMLTLLPGLAASAQQPPPPPQEAAPDQSQRKFSSLVVEVKDEEGKPLEHASVSLDNAGGTTERAGSTGESGFVQLILVKAGNYFVRVRLKGYAMGEQSVRLEADKRGELVFVMKKAQA